MHIKKFTADNMKQAMSQVKLELGDEAIILQTKKVNTGGFLGFFKKEKIEVLAAVENDTAKTKRNPGSAKSMKIEQNKIDDIGPEISKGSGKTNIPNKNNIQDSAHSYKALQERLNEKAFSQKVPEEKKIENTSSRDNIIKDIDEIKNVISQLSTKLNRVIEPEKDEPSDDFKKQAMVFLKNKGISEELSHQIIEMCNNNECVPDNELYYTILKERFEGYKLSEEFNFSKKFNVFIGPTGVGKTTTLAKLASMLAINENKSIGFLTMDTYRISAVEQLRTYAEILNCPLEVAYDKKDVSDALSRLSNKDTVFIDTAGRSHKNHKHMTELEDLLKTIKEKEIFLVISANYNQLDIKDIISRYSFIENYHLIITKLDETSRTGIIFDIINDSGKAVTYITYGQNVPDDIETFDLSKFINDFLREN